MIDVQNNDVIYIYNIAGGTESVWDVNKPLHLTAKAVDRKTQDEKPLYELLNQIKENNKTIRVERKRKVIYIG